MKKTALITASAITGQIYTFPGPDARWFEVLADSRRARMVQKGVRAFPGKPCLREGVNWILMSMMTLLL